MTLTATPAFSASVAVCAADPGAESSGGSARLGSRPNDWRSECGWLADPFSFAATRSRSVWSTPLSGSQLLQTIGADALCRVQIGVDHPSVIL